MQPYRQALPTEMGNLLSLRWLTMNDNKLEVPAASAKMARLVLHSGLN